MEVELYVKEHNKTGLKYFGKHKVCSESVYDYSGSGTKWLEHLQEYGDDVTTHIVGKWDVNDPELVYAALSISEYFNIVESNEWANMKPENGLDGGFEHLNDGSPEHIERAKKGRKIANENGAQEKALQRLKELRENEEWYSKVIEKRKKTLQKYYENNPGMFFGKTHSDEAKSKISKANKNKVTGYDLINNKYVKIDKEEFDNNPNIVGLRSKKIPKINNNGMF